MKYTYYQFEGECFTPRALELIEPTLPPGDYRIVDGELFKLVPGIPPDEGEGKTKWKK